MRGHIGGNSGARQGHVASALLDIRPDPWYNALMRRLRKVPYPVGKVSDLDLIPFGFPELVNRYLLRCTIDSRGCWNYPTIAYYNAKRAHPIIHIDGKNRTLSRVVYEVTTNQEPKEKVIRHACDNARCVNPLHLYTEGEFDVRIP